MTVFNSFEERYLPCLVERLMSLWGVNGETDEFNRLYVEMVVRTNMHLNDIQFQLTENNSLKAIAFGAAKNDKEYSDWYLKHLKTMDIHAKSIFETGRKYLLRMEEKTFSLMNEDDVKLCLFVSLETGWGKKILAQVMEKFKSRGYKNMFLWTDSECNVQWYFDNGYQLLEQEEYEPFSTDVQKYMTYIFKKSL